MPVHHMCGTIIDMAETSSALHASKHATQEPAPELACILTCSCYICSRAGCMHMYRARVHYSNRLADLTALIAATCCH